MHVLKNFTVMVCADCIVMRLEVQKQGFLNAKEHRIMLLADACELHVFGQGSHLLEDSNDFV